MDMEELITYGNNLIEFLKDEKDVVGLKHFLRQSSSLRFQCEKDFNQVQKTIEDYTKKIVDCKQKTDVAESESVSDAELSLLQKELEEEQQLEQMLRAELRVVVNEIVDLERQEDPIEEQSRNIKKFEQDEMRSQMKLSMYASVTNIIPCLDNQSKISGHIVDREKKVVDKFEFDPSKVSGFDTCNNIWKMIKS